MAEFSKCFSDSIPIFWWKALESRPKTLKSPPKRYRSSEKLLFLSRQHHGYPMLPISSIIPGHYNSSLTPSTSLCFPLLVAPTIPQVHPIQRLYVVGRRHGEWQFFTGAAGDVLCTGCTRSVGLEELLMDLRWIPDSVKGISWYLVFLLSLKYVLYCD